MTKNSHFAWCNNSNCEHKDDCLRYGEDENIMYIKFENLLSDEECKYFIKKEMPIAKMEEKQNG